MNEIPGKLTESEVFFSNLTLQKIFGHEPEINKREKMLAWWVPDRIERGIIGATLEKISDGKKPTVIDVGCGTGFLLALLSQEIDANFVGIETSRELTDIPHAQNISFIDEDVWHAQKRLQPKIPPQDSGRKNKLLDTLGVKLSHRKNLAWNHDVGGTFPPNSLDKSLGELSKKLQTLNGQYPHSDSVDLVICSFMEPWQELTTPIRDGISPKAILYVRPMNGLSGAGDFFDVNTPQFRKTWESEPTDFIMSFDPGQNYQIVHRNPTGSKIGWDETEGNWNWNADYRHQFLKNHASEFVLMLRRDQAHHTITPTARSKKSYPFDKDLDFFKSTIVPTLK